MIMSVYPWLKLLLSKILPLLLTQRLFSQVSASVEIHMSLPTTRITATVIQQNLKLLFLHYSKFYTTCCGNEVLNVSVESLTISLLILYIQRWTDAIFSLWAYYNDCSVNMINVNTSVRVGMKITQFAHPTSRYLVLQAFTIKYSVSKAPSLTSKCCCRTYPCYRGGLFHVKQNLDLQGIHSKLKVESMNWYFYLL